MPAACFDSADAQYLAEALTPAQLRQEIASAWKRQSYRRAILALPCQMLWGYFWNERLQGGQLSSAGVALLNHSLDIDETAFIEIARAAKDVQRAATHARFTHHGRQRIDAADVKARVDIVDIAGRYTFLKKSGRNFSGKCPLHEEHSPSFMVYPDRQTWHCYGACNRGGDVIDLVMTAERVDFRRACEILNGSSF